MNRGNPYPNRYRYGKQEEIIPFSKIVKLVAKADLPIQEEAYFWLLYHTGVRASEGYERIVEDFKITETHVHVDFHKRKKGGAKTPVISLPRDYVGIDKLITQIELARVGKKRFKFLYFTEKTGETKTSEKGRVTPVTRLAKKRVKARWVFPKIQSWRAWKTVKKVLGKKYYPHFLRLICLTEIGSDPTASLTRMKSFSGIKTISALEYYLGTSKKETDKALEFRARQMQ